MTNEYSIALNFFPLLDQDQNFKIFRKKVEEQQKPFEDCVKYSLPTNSEETYESYWVSYTNHNEFQEFECNYHTNRSLTLNFLFKNICQSSKESLEEGSFEIRKKIGNRIHYNVEYFKEGKRQVSVEPYFLKSINKFGILLNFEFKNETRNFNRKIQQLSLSLDANFRSNTSYYADKYWMIGKFINSDFSKIFIDRFNLKCISKFENIKSYKLDIKNYTFNQGVANSQYLGIKNYKPLKTVDDELILYFIYRKGEREYAVKLIDALKGKSFPNVFPGLEKLFELRVGGIKGVSLNNFSDQNIINSINEIKKIKRRVLPVVLLDDKEIDKENSKKYYRVKHHFINNDYPIQVVTKGLIDNQYSFKYSVANIALQLFSKAGGIPWKVKARNEKCLIIGIGKSHRWDNENNERVIKQFYAYSVLVDSSGIFKSINVLSQSNSEENYYEGLKNGLKETILKNEDKYQKIVLHTPFKIRKKEFQAIIDVLSKIKSETNIEFVVLKINTNNKFFGFYKGLNSLVPYESSFMVIGEKEYLVWFEGSQYHNKRIQKRFGGPTHIEVSYSSAELNLNDKKSYLQDTINLSGANWRGFNSKSLPVSIYYCQIISRFLNEFDSLNYDKISIQNLKPWFI